MAEATSNDPSVVEANITTNSQGFFLAVSPQFLELTGRSVEALAGVNLGDFIHPEDAPAVRAALAAAGERPGLVNARLFSVGERWLQLQITVRSIGDDRLAVELQLRVPHPEPGAEPAAAAQFSTPASGSSTPSVVALPAAPLAEFLAGKSSGGDVLPTAPVESDHDVAHDDSPEHRAYVATLPADPIPRQRAAVREAAGDDHTPIIEVDPQGRTVYMSGDWSSLSADGADGADGADVFEALLDRSGQADQILDAIASVFISAKPSHHELAVAGLPPRWAWVVPIPSPHRSGVVNALIAVVPESMLDRPPVVVAAPPDAPAVADGQDQAPDASQSDVEPAAHEEPSRPSASRETAGSLDGAGIEAGDTAADEHQAEEAAPLRTAAAKWTRWLVWALVGVVALLALNNLVGGDGDEPVAADPITTELVATQAAQVSDTQVWRLVGAESLGEIYGIAATEDGAVVADIQGRIIRLDADGASVGAAGLTGGADTFVSDLAHAGSGTVWVLDAGLGQLSSVSPNGTVTRVDSNPDPLRNARGLGSGRDGTIWVASTAAAQLTQLASDGSLVGTIPLPGRQPSDVVELDDASLWVVDAQEIELIHVAANGEIVGVIPLESFSSVQAPHLAVAGGRLWVTEPDGSAMFAVELDTGQISTERIQISRPDGSSVVRPIGIDVGPDGRFWIVDSMGAGIVIVDG